jgi:hypothetical protein
LNTATWFLLLQCTKSITFLENEDTLKGLDGK